MNYISRSLPQLLLLQFLLLNYCSSTGTIKEHEDKKITKAILTGEMIEMEEELLDIEPGDKESRQGISFLHIAAKDGKLQIVQDIMKTGLDINTRDYAGNTPLHYAVINGWLDIVELLIKSGADINIKNRKGQTPLHFAALSVAIVSKQFPSILPLEGSFTSEFGIRHSPFTGNYQFHNGIDIGAPVGTPIKATADGLVVKHGWYGVLGNVIIIQHENGLSTVYGHCKEVKVYKGIRVRQGEVIALVGTTGSSTGYHCHYEIFNNGLAVNPMPYLQLEDRSEIRKSIHIIKHLLEHNAQLNLIDSTGKTALHYAATRNIDAAGLFIASGSALNMQDIYGLTPLHYAVMTDVAITRLLLRSGAKVNVKSKKTYTSADGIFYRSGSTPLAIAMKRESLEMAKLLLRYGGIE